MAGHMEQSMNVGQGNSAFQIGTNHGPIYTENRKADRIDIPAPLVATSTVPFPPDKDFVRREDILLQLREKLSRPYGRAALVGLGGIGKSQLAIAYSYLLREQSLRTWVFWVYAGNNTRFQQDVQLIAERLRIGDDGDAGTRTVTKLREWLANPAHGNWLMIFDNADDADVLVGKPSDNEGKTAGWFYDNLPVCAHGSILITSRYRRAALRLSIDDDDIISVSAMEEKTSLSLLQKKMGTRESEPELLRLARILGGVPLAMTQATAYITRRSPRCSVQQYVELLIACGQSENENILNLDEHDNRRDRQAINSTSRTLQITLSHILGLKRSAIQLLLYMTLSDPSSIPEIFLKHRKHPRPELDYIIDIKEMDIKDIMDKMDITNRRSLLAQGRKITSRDFNIPPPTRFGKRVYRCTPQCDECIELENDIEILMNYNLISCRKDQNSFLVDGADLRGLQNSYSMHVMVQVAARRWTAAQNVLGILYSGYLTKLEEILPNFFAFPFSSGQEMPAKLNIMLYHALAPHMVELYHHGPVGMKETFQWETILQKWIRLVFAAMNSFNGRDQIDKAANNNPYLRHVGLNGRVHPHSIGSRLCMLAMALVSDAEEPVEFLLLTWTLWREKSDTDFASLTVQIHGLAHIEACFALLRMDSKAAEVRRRIFRAIETEGGHQHTRIHVVELLTYVRRWLRRLRIQLATTRIRDIMDSIKT